MKDKFAAVILNALLDRYERSAPGKRGLGENPDHPRAGPACKGLLFKREGAASPADRLPQDTGESDDKRYLRKIWFRFDRKNLPAYFDDTSARPKTEINETCQALAARGLIEIRWVRHEEGNLIEKVALNTAAVEEAYRYLGRRPRAAAAGEVCVLARRYAGDAPAWAVSFFDYIVARIERGESVARYLDIEDTRRVELLFRAIRELGRLDEETPRRIFSQRALGYSKALESVAGALARVARDFHPAFQNGEGEGEAWEKKEVLAELGLVDNPGYLFISGPLKFSVAGRSIDVSAFSPDVGLPAAMVSKMTVEGLGTGRVITIENLTSYHQFIRHCAGRFLAVYLGGYHNSPRRLFVTKLHEYLQRSGREAAFYHWGDIDYGGFTIFNHLRTKCGLSLIPLYMDIATLERYEKFAIPFDRTYGQKLQRLLERDEYRVFYEVIRFMLEKRIRLEQECVEVDFDHILEQTVI